MKQPKQAEEVAEPLKTQSLRPGTPIWYVAAVVIVVVATLSGFFAGVQVGSRSDDSVSKIMNEQNPGGRGGMGMMGAGMGIVTQVSEASITVESQAPPMGRDGRLGNSSGTTTTTYKISSNTKVTNSGNSAAIADIKSGDRVIVRANADDETMAESIEINPQMGGGRGMNAQGGAASGANS
ncbi:hypothetical protein I8H83_00940 [Candidatus Saccharibacteria bacterium]|nr:hypothetical protein [Candidatus Saccharibacteria bacterium]